MTPIDEIEGTPIPEIQIGTRRMPHLRSIALQAAVLSTNRHRASARNTERMLVRADEFLVWLKTPTTTEGTT